MEQPAPAYEGEEPYVFVSYSHQDEALVYREIRWLQGQGIKVWYDTQIQAGSEWSDALANAIGRCSRFLYFITPDSVASENCRRELNHAISEGRSVLAVHLLNTEVPPGIRLSLNNRQAILKHRLKLDDYHSTLLGALSAAAPDSRATSPERSSNRNTPPLSANANVGMRWKWVTPVAGLAGLAGLAALTLAGAILWEYRIDEATSEREVTPERLQPAIAVLPFVNISSDPDQEYFSEGVAEDVLNELAKNTKLVVRPRSSSFLFKGSREDPQSIGAKLNVTHLVEGSVQKADQNVRVSARLIRVADSTSLWSESYTRQLQDIFRVQDEITREILSALEIQLGVRERAERLQNEEAYDALLRGRFLRERGQYLKAGTWFEQATELNPNYADAWAMRALVSAYLSAVGFASNSGETLEQRVSFIRNALSADPGNAIALGTRALMDTHYRDRDYERAITELVRLSELHPNDVDLLYYLSYVFTALGKRDLVDQVTSRAVEIAPLSRTAFFIRASGFVCLGPERAFRDYMEHLASLGVTSPLLSVPLALFDGDGARLRAAAREPSILPDFYQYWWEAQAAFLEGDPDGVTVATDRLRREESYVPHFVLSSVALLVGDYNAAVTQHRLGIEEGEQAAIQQAQGCVWQRATFPDYFAAPAYRKMLEEFGLDPTSIAKIEVPPLPF